LNQSDNEQPPHPAPQAPEPADPPAAAGPAETTPNAGDPPPDPDPEPERRKRKAAPLKWAMRLALVLLFILGLVIAFLPGIASGGWAKARLLEAVNNAIQGHADVDRIQLSWFGAQRLRGVTLLDPDREPAAAFDSLRVEGSLFSLLAGGRNLGRIQLTGLDVRYLANADGKSNLHAALAPRRNAQPPGRNPDDPAPRKKDQPFRIPFAFQLHATDASLTLHAPGQEPTHASGLNLALDASTPGQPITVSLTSGVDQGTRQGRLEADLKITGYQPDRTLDLDNLGASGQLEITGLPPDGLDAMLGLDGLIAAALGGPLNLTLNLDAPPQGPQSLRIVADAPAFQTFRLNARRAQNNIDADGKIVLIAQPNLVEKLAALTDDFNGRLAAGVPLTLNINTLRSPADRFNPAASAFDVALTVGAGELLGDERLGNVTWSEIVASSRTENLAQALRLRVEKTDLTVRGRTGAVLARLDLARLFDAQGNPTPDEATLDGEVAMVDLPVELIDLLAGLDGLASAAIGGPLDLNAAVVGPAAGQQSLTLTADAPNIQRFSFTARREGQSLTADGAAVLIARPQLIDALARNNPHFRPRLADAVPITLTLTLGNLAAGLDGFDPATFAIDLSLDVGAGELRGDPRLGVLAWKPANATVKTDNLADALALRLADTPITVQGEAARVFGHANLSRLFDPEARFRDDAVAADGRFVVQGLPAALLDALAGLDGLAQNAMAKVNLTADFNGSADKHIDADLDIADPTDERRRAVLPLRIAERLTLQPNERASVRFLPTDALLKALVPDDAGLQVAAGQPLQLFIDALDAPGLGADADAFTPDAVSLAGRLVLTDLEARHAPDDPAEAIGAVRVAKLTLDLAGDSLARPTLTGRGRLETPGPGLAADYLGRAIALNLDADAELDRDFKLVAANADLGLSNPDDAPQPLESLQLKLEADPRLDRIALREPGVVKYRVAPTMLSPNGDSLTIADPVLATVALDKFDAALADFALERAKLAGRINLDDAALAGDRQLAGAKLSGLAGSFSVDGPANKLKAALNGRFATAPAHGDAPGQAKPATLAADLDLQGWLAQGRPSLEHAAGAASVRVKGLPARDAEAISQLTGWIEPFVGPAVDASVKVSLNPDRDAPSPLGLPLDTVDLVVEGEKIALKPRLRFGDDVVTLVQPVDATLTLSEREYASLMNRAQAPAALQRWSLVDGVEPRLSLKALTLPLPIEGRTPRMDLSKAVIEAEFAIPRFVAKNERSALVTRFGDIAGHITTADPTRRLTLSLTGKAVRATPAEGQPKTEDIKLALDLVDLFDADGGVREDALRAAIEARLAALPVALLDAVLDADGQLIAAFGAEAALQGNAELERFTGPVALNLNADHAKADLQGHVDQGVLYLKKPLSARFTVTEELGEKWLERVHPLLKSSQTGEEPITLTLDPGEDGKGVAIPLAKLNLADVRIDRGTLDLGKIKAKPGPLLVGLKKLAGRNPRGETSLWFTPLRFSMNNGRIAYKRRLDLLIDQSFHVATWGSVQLDTAVGEKDNSKLNLYFGLPRDTLDDVFGLDNASPKDLFTIPIRGRIDDPKIDFAAAAADMARLQAQYKLIDNPLAAAVLNRLINQMLRPGGEGSPPAASVDALPWAREEKAPAPENQGNEGDDGNNGDGPANADADDAPNKRPKDPVRDAIRDLFR